MGLTNFDFVIIQTEAELKFTSGTESFTETWEKCGCLLGTGGQDINIPNQEFSLMQNKTEHKSLGTSHTSHSQCALQQVWQVTFGCEERKWYFAREKYKTDE